MIGLSIYQPPSVFPYLAELATVDHWPSRNGINTSTAGLRGFGAAQGVRISLADGFTQSWRRAYHDPNIPLVPGGTYECKIWFKLGTSGLLRANAYGDGGQTELLITCSPEPNVQRSDRFEITDLGVREFSKGAYELGFVAAFDAGAHGEVRLGIGPNATAAGEDVILIAARLVQTG